MYALNSQVSLVFAFTLPWPQRLSMKFTAQLLYASPCRSKGTLIYAYIYICIDFVSIRCLHFPTPVAQRKQRCDRKKKKKKSSAIHSRRCVWVVCDVMSAGCMHTLMLCFAATCLELVCSVSIYCRQKCTLLTVCSLNSRTDKVYMIPVASVC